MLPDDANFIQLRETVLSFATSNAERVELLGGLAQTSPPEEVGRTLAALAVDLPADVLGYSILPALSDWLMQEDGRACGVRKLGFACKFASSTTGIEFMHPTRRLAARTRPRRQRQRVPKRT